MQTSASTEEGIYNLGPCASVPPGEGRLFKVNGTEVALFHQRDGQFFATQPYCPHRGGPLADGLVGAGVVICPLHSYAFDLASGVSVEGTCPNVRTYPVIVNQANELLVVLNS